jgi:hypothetical protein
LFLIVLFVPLFPHFRLAPPVLTVDMPRSSYYYKKQKPDESQLEHDLKTVAGQFPRSGVSRTSYQWQPPGI